MYIEHLIQALLLAFLLLLKTDSLRLIYVTYVKFYWYDLLRRKCDPDPVAIRRYVRRRDRWTIWMGGAGRSGDGLRMVSRVCVGGAGRTVDGLRMFNRVSL